MSLPAMPFPRVRFTVRRMMAAVAILAILVGGYVERQRRFRRLSLRYSSLWMATVNTMMAQPAELNNSEGSEEATLFWKADRYSKLRDKYDRAARYPWLPVAPDPPEPE